jgi:glycosyltransferase involved in cell wall biosynthesis
MSVAASVIVCTRDRAGLLDGCLERLVAEDPSVTWELVVVDNGSTDATASVVRRHGETVAGGHVTRVVEPEPGLSPARNRGVAAARGDLLLFTDDDVLVEPGWIDAMCAGFGEPDVVAVAGRVGPWWPREPPRWLTGPHAGLLALTDFGDAPRDLVGDEYPLGASMGIRRSALPAAAPFDPRLGHRAGTFFAYEEFDLFQRLRRAGGRFVYRPDAAALHRIDPERMTWRGMRRAAIHNGFGLGRAQRVHGPVPVPRRKGVARAARTWASAARRSRRNGARDDVDPRDAQQELMSYWELGHAIEAAFGGSRLGPWLIDRAV